MNVKIRLLKKIDSVAGPVLVRLAGIVPAAAEAPLSEECNILFIRPGGIGDAVLLIPAIRSMREKFPRASIDVLCEKRNHEIFKLCPEVDSILLYDRGFDVFSALGRRYDAVVDTEQWYRLSAIVAYMTRSPIRAGFRTNERRLLFNRPVDYYDDEYEALSFLRLTAAITGVTAQFNGAPFISIPQELSERVKSFLFPSSVNEWISIFPGGSIDEKKWGTDRFRQVAGKMLGSGFGVVVVGGRNDFNVGKSIVEGLKGALNLCGSLDLSETAALLSRASLLITGDSGIMHVASAVGTKTLSLFGPGNEKKWAPMGANHMVIKKGLHCSPCSRFGHTPLCRRGKECMEMIGVEEVFNEAMELLER